MQEQASGAVGGAIPAPVWQASSFVEVLRWRARAQPGRTAYTFLRDGGGSGDACTYAGLEREVRAFARRLRALAAPGERALLLLPSGLDYVVAFLGCLQAGVVAVPAYPPANRRHLARLHAIADDCDPAVAVTNAAADAALARARAQAVAGRLDAASLRWLRMAHDAAADAADDAPAPLSEPAFLQYTSGSTGRPKGVMVGHANLLHNARLFYSFIDPRDDDVGVSWLPLFHDMGLILGILQPLFGGYPCVFMPPAAFLQRPACWLQALSDHGGTISAAPDSAYRLCVERLSSIPLAGLRLERWRAAINAAEPVHGDTMRAFADAFAGAGFRHASFAPAYGLAEATLFVAGKRHDQVPALLDCDRQALEQEQRLRRGSGAQLAACGSVPDGLRVAIADPASSRCRREPSARSGSPAPAWRKATGAARTTPRATSRRSWPAPAPAPGCARATWARWSTANWSSADA